jgi:hypothetical protein
MLRALRVRLPVLKTSASPTHAPHTGMTCGVPSAREVATRIVGT